MDSDAKLQISDRGISPQPEHRRWQSTSAVDVAISTMSDAALERDVAAFVSERLDSRGRWGAPGDGPRGRAVEPDGAPDRPRSAEALWVVVVRMRCAPLRRMRASSGSTPTKSRPATSRARTASLRDAASVAAPVARELRARCAPYARGRAGSGSGSRSPSASIWTVLLPISPLFPSRSMSSPSAAGAICSKAPNRRCSKRG